MPAPATLLTQLAGAVVFGLLLAACERADERRSHDEGPRVLQLDSTQVPLPDSVRLTVITLDHSVRTVNQCRTVAAGDLSAAVGMLDLTGIAGDPTVVASTRSVIAHDWRASARKRLPQLVDGLRMRHARHGDLAQSLEPDLKEARGGLRDMTVLRALAEAWLADRPHGAVDEAHLVTDALADLLTELLRDATRAQTRRDTPRLQHQDLRVARVEQRPRHTRRLAGAGGCLEHHRRMRA